MRDFLKKGNNIEMQKAGLRAQTGIGYAIINDIANREDYIKNCELKSICTIRLENGGVIENVPVLKHVWNDITFPLETDKLGSCVLWERVVSHNFIIITGIIVKPDEISNNNENQFILSRTIDNNNVEISGDAKSGTINISINGDSKSEFNLNVANKNKKAKLNIIVKGTAILDVDGTADIFASDGISIRNEDETLTTVLDDLIETLKNAIIQTPSGPGSISPSTVKLIKTIQVRLSKLLIKNGS